MRRLLHSRAVDQALRGASLVLTDRRWAAPLSAAALGFGIFAGVAIGPGATGTLATGAQQIIELPSSGGEEGQSGGGGGGVASTASSILPGGGGGGEAEEAFSASLPLAAAAPEPLPAPAPAPAAKPAPAGEKEAAPAEEEAEGQTLEGTVVQVSDPAGSYALAIKGGELVSVHALELPPPGTKLSAPVRRLANGTFAEDGKPSREKQLSKVASFRGGVTYVDADPAAPAYTVSTRGASLLVHTKPDPSGAAPELPAIGAYVTVTAQIGDELSQQRLELEPGPPSTYLDLAGIFREVSPETGQLLLSADDAGESEADLTLSLPKEIDASRLKAGDSYLATAELGEDGSLALKGIAGDERSKGADDAGSAQGDLKRQTGS